MAVKPTRTVLRRTRSKHVAEAVAIFREKNALSFEALEALIYHAGHEVSVSTLKRLVNGQSLPHATTLAALEAFLTNRQAPASIKRWRQRDKHGKKTPARERALSRRRAQER